MEKYLPFPKKKDFSAFRRWLCRNCSEYNDLIDTFDSYRHDAVSVFTINDDSGVIIKNNPDEQAFEYVAWDCTYSMGCETGTSGFYAYYNER